MDKISVFDTSISDYNLGNQIIMESVWEHLYDVFPSEFFFKLPYMEITSHTLTYIKWSDKIFFGGTNSLSSNMEKYKQWGLSILNCHKIKNVVLMGIGWWQYQDVKTSFYTQYLLNTSLTKKYLHSTRDSYTKKKLSAIGFENVVNTGCPTIWNLTKQHCTNIPIQKCDNLLITITDYKQDKNYDTKFIALGFQYYKNVYCWIQGKGDLAYIQTLNFPNLKMINPTLQAFDEFLSNNDVDYIGTRLHAGIRALQYQKRTLILAVDNRAIEMAKDFNLPVIDRKNAEFIENQFIKASFETKIEIPNEAIQEWKSQFSKNV